MREIQLADTRHLPIQVQSRQPHQIRAILGHERTVHDDWNAGTLRFNELRSRVAGISQRMLTVTLRGMERDGLVKRTVYPEVPPRVEYNLTKLGATVRQLVRGLVEWSEAHLAEVDTARAAYDARDRQPTKSVPGPRAASQRRSHTSLIAG